MATEPMIIHLTDSIIAELSQGEIEDCVKDFLKTWLQETRMLTLEQLKTEVFGQNWRDEAWQEVLRSICGRLDARFAGEILEDLLSLDGKVEEFKNLFFAASCLLAMRERDKIKAVDGAVREQLINLVNEGLSPAGREPEGESNKWAAPEPEYRNFSLLRPLEPLTENSSLRQEAVKVFARTYSYDSETFSVLKQCAMHDRDYLVRDRAIKVLVQYYKDERDFLPWLQDLVLHNANWFLQGNAVDVLAQYYQDVPELLLWLKERALFARDFWEQQVFVQALGKYYRNNPDALTCLKECATRAIKYDIQPSTSNDKLGILVEKNSMRKAAMEAIAQYYRDDPNTLPWLKECAIADKKDDVRESALKLLGKYYRDDPDTLASLEQSATQARQQILRLSAIETLAEQYSENPKTLAILNP